MFFRYLSKTVKIQQQVKIIIRAHALHRIYTKLSALLNTLVGLTVKVVSTAPFWRGMFLDWIRRPGDLGHHAEVWGGNSRSLVLCMRKHAFHTCWVWCVEQSWDQRLQNAESGKVDIQREVQISKQEQMNLCYDSTGWKSCTQSDNQWHLQPNLQRANSISTNTYMFITMCT